MFIFSKFKGPIKKRDVAYFLLLSSVSILVILLISTYIFISEKQASFENLETTEVNKLDLQLNEIITDFTFVERDLLLLRDMMASVETYSQEKGITLNILKHDFLQYIYHKGLYDQIRFIDKDGYERLRVNYNSGEPIIVADSLLQDKSDRYYFKEMRRLDKGDLYFSKFDLNIEDGVIEVPYKPVVRVGTRVFDCDDQFCGVIVANYKGEGLIKRIKALNTNSISRIHVLEPKGYFLVSPNIEDNWGFMFEDKKDKTYAKIYPKAWDQLNDKGAGQFVTQAGLFTFRTLTFHQIASHSGVENLAYYSTDDYWKIVSFVSASKMTGIYFEILSRFYLPVSLLIFLSIVLSFFITKLRVRAQEVKKTIVDKNEFLFNVINALSDAFYVIGANDNKIYMANKKANQHNICEGNRLDDNTLFVGDENRGKIMDLRDRVISSEESKQIELKIAIEEQAYNYYEISAYPIFDKNHKVYQIIEVITDVTDEKLLDKKFKDLLASAPDGMIITNTKGVIEMVNNQAEKMFLYKAHELIGKKIEVLIPSKHHDHVRMRSKYAQRPTVRRMGEGKELAGLKSDNSQFPVEVSLNPIQTSAGVLISSAIRDISEKKRIERQIKESEQKFKALFDNQSQLIGLLQPDGTIIEINETTLQFAGCTIDEVKDKMLWESPWWINDSVRKQIKDAILTASKGEFVRFEVEAKGKDSTVVTLDFSLQPVRNEEDDIILIIPEARDITEKKIYEQGLKNRERQWYLFVKQTPNAVAMFDTNLNYLAVSDRWCSDYNIVDQDIIGKNHHDVFPEIRRDKPEWIQHFKDCLRGETVRRPEEIFNRLDGSVNWISFEIRPWYNEMGNVGGIIIFTEEITERKKIENEIKKLNEGLEEKVKERTLELEKANKLIIASKDEAEKANKVKSVFLANMSHEIRTPMNAVIGFSEILSKRVVDPVQKEFVDSIKNSGRTLLGIINDILDLSKMEAGKLKIQTEPVRITELAKDLKVLFYIRTKEKNLDLIINISDNMPAYIVIDELRIKQVLINLISNAIKFTNEGFVKLTLKAVHVLEDEIELRICVEDSGIGISKEDQTRIFEAFHQKEGQMTKEYGGTGLGLAISNKIVSLLDSRLQVASKIGEGSNFSFTLKHVPIFKGEPQVNTTFDFNLEEIQFKGSKILIVDDVKRNRDLIKNFLLECDLQIEEADNGISGIQKCIEVKPDLILMDIKMAGMDGNKALVKLREMPAFKKIPIIAVTASVHLNKSTKVGNYQFDAILYKPINLDELLSVLTQHLPFSKVELLKKEENTETLVLNDLVLDDALKHEFKKEFEGTILMLKKRKSNKATNQLKLKLVTFGESHGIDTLSQLGQKLSVAVGSFNISFIEELTNSFMTYYDQHINSK